MNMKTAYALLRATKLVICFLFIFFFCTSASYAQSTNKAIDLDGFSSYADLGAINPAGNFSNGLTIECWAKWDGFNDWSRLLDLGNGPGSDNILFANESNSSNLRFEVYQDGSTEGITSPVAMETNRWYHVAVTQTSTGFATIYIDGVEAASGTIHQPLDVIRFNCYIGLSNWPSDGYFDGQIDEMRIWNVARTQSEIRQFMFKPVASNAAGLVAYYKCNEGSGEFLINSSTNDLAGNAYNPGSLGWIDSPIEASANALAIDGVDDFVSIGTPLSAGSSYTKEAWIYVTKSTIVPNNVVSSNGSPLWIDNGSLKAGNNGPVPEVTDPAPFPTNTWVHVAVTYDVFTGTLSLYRDGFLVSSTTSGFGYAGEDNYIGAWFNGTATESNLGGMIDEVRIWNVARTQAQIQADMNRELNPSTESNLVAYYTFNQGLQGGDNTGMITVYDQKETSNGTLMNMALSSTSSNFVQQQNALIVLPVRLTSFTLQKQGGSVQLQWSTASEQNALDFVVQHSGDGRTWTNLATIAAAGNSSTLRNYVYVHTAPVSGRNYYRIAQRDQDKKSRYSDVRTVVFENPAKAFSVQSNLVKSGTLEVQIGQATVLSLFSQDGRILWSKELSAGKQNIPLGTYAKGIYFLKAAGTTEKIVIQ
jgi:hypothetical protein